MASLKSGSTVGGVAIATIADVGKGATGVRLNGTQLEVVQFGHAETCDIKDFDIVFMGLYDFTYSQGNLAAVL